MLDLSSYVHLFDLNFAKMKKNCQGNCDVILELRSRSRSPKKFTVLVHLVHINIKYMAMLCKKIFRFQCVLAVAGPAVMHMTVKQTSTPAIAGRAQKERKKTVGSNLFTLNYEGPRRGSCITFCICTCSRFLRLEQVTMTSIET